VKSEDQAVHLVWIGKSLPLMGQLSIKLFQRHGKMPHLWSYEEIENVPDGVERRDASEILDRDSIFTFQGDQPGLENNGRGSVSHWSDIFQLTLLRKYGGWYSQLDVACMKFPARCEYYFARHHDRTVINTFIMRVPKNAPFLDACLAELTAKINKSTSSKIGWFDGMRIVGSHVNAKLPQFISRKTFECGCPVFTDTDATLKRRYEFLHWCNALCVTIRNGPVREDSLYTRLLKQEGLI
jgi:hypothetical protein